MVTTSKEVLKVSEVQKLPLMSSRIYPRPDILLSLSPDSFLTVGPFAFSLGPVTLFFFPLRAPMPLSLLSERQNYRFHTHAHLLLGTGSNKENENAIKKFK